MMETSLATCPIEFYREQSAKAKNAERRENDDQTATTAASDAFDKWHEIEAMLKLKRHPSCIIEIQTRLNRALTKVETASSARKCEIRALVIDLNHMLGDIVNPGTQTDHFHLVHFRVHECTARLFQYFRLQRYHFAMKYEDDMFSSWQLRRDDSYIVAEKKMAWKFIKYASLYALNSGLNVSLDELTFD